MRLARLGFIYHLRYRRKWQPARVASRDSATVSGATIIGSADFQFLIWLPKSALLDRQVVDLANSTQLAYRLSHIDLLAGPKSAASEVLLIASLPIVSLRRLLNLRHLSGECCALLAYQSVCSFFFLSELKKNNRPACK